MFEPLLCLECAVKKERKEIKNPKPEIREYLCEPLLIWNPSAFF